MRAGWWDGTRTARFGLAAFLCGCFSAEAVEKEAETTAQMPASAVEVRPLLVGAAVPDVSVHTVEGQPVSLRQVLAEKPTVVIFYRGGW